MEWRYRNQLDWRLVLIGLTESVEQYTSRGYTSLSMAKAYTTFRRFGMPFSTTPRARVCSTARACRAIASARALYPGCEWKVFRALQIAWFTTQLLLDEDQAIFEAIEMFTNLNAKEILANIDSPEVEEAYQLDRAEARTASGSATEFQGKAAQTDGTVRYTAPSLIFEHQSIRFEAGGFQPVEVYDSLISNMNSLLTRQANPETPQPLFKYFSEGLTTQEVAALITQGNDLPDQNSAEQFLLELSAEKIIRRMPLGDSALWVPITS